MDSLLSLRIEVCVFHYGPQHCTGILAVPLPGVYIAWEFVALRSLKKNLVSMVVMFALLGVVA